MKASTMTHNDDDTTNQLQSGTHNAIDKVAHAASQAVDALSQTGERLRDSEQHVLKNYRGFIQDNPVASLGIAVGIGFLISRLLSSR